jgi:biotin carboxyl carrier protein
VSFRRDFLRGGAPVTVKAAPAGGDRWHVRVGERVHEFRVTVLGDGGVQLVPVGADAPANAVACVAYGAPAGKSYQVRVGGQTMTLLTPEARRGTGAAGADGTVRAPMTGTITKVLCKPGDAVVAEQTLVVLSAMKMEHKLTAGIAGVVESVAAREGGTADQGAVLAVVAKA